MKRAALAILTGWLVASACASSVLIKAPRWLDADGRLQSGAAVLVSDGRIADVNAVQADVTHEYADGVLCPGLVDIGAQLGAAGQLRERQSALQPNASAADVFDVTSEQLRQALHAGVTAFALSPDDSNLVGGAVAVCVTGGPSGPTVRAPRACLKLSLSPEAFLADREPTSRSGAIGLLRDALREAREDARADGLFSEFAAGRSTGLFAAPSGADVLSVLNLAEEFGLRLAIEHTDDARDVAGAIARAGAAAIVGPLGLDASIRQARAAADYAKAGVRIALAGGLPQRSADSLRISAAVAVRAGLDPAVARRSVTRTPAEILGVADQLGAIEKGLRADLVIFSGDPLDPRSRVLAVYVAGQRVLDNRASGGR